MESELTTNGGGSVVPFTLSFDGRPRVSAESDLSKDGAFRGARF